MAESAYIHSIRKKFFSSRSAVSGVAGIIFFVDPRNFCTFDRQWQTVAADRRGRNLVDAVFKILFRSGKF